MTVNLLYFIFIRYYSQYEFASVAVPDSKCPMGATHHSNPCTPIAMR